MSGLALTAPAQASDEVAKPIRPLIIASGTVTGLYYPMAGAICRQMNQEKIRHRFNCLVEATSGPVYNLNALRDGDVDLAMVQSDWQAAAFKGEGRFAGGGPFKELRAVATLHAETVTLLVRPDAGIDSLGKLKGKRVNLGPRGSALRNIADLVVDAANVKVDDDEADLMPDDALARLCDGQLDAAFFAVGHPNAGVKAAMAGCGAVPVAVTGAGIDKMLAGRKDMMRTVVPAALYSELDEDVETVGVAATLVTRADVPDAAIAELVRVLLEDRSALSEQHPAFGGVSADGMGQRARTAPLHPAAEKAYAATGVGGDSK